MANLRLIQQIQFIVEVDKLKEILRQTLLTQSRRQENDAEHSWHLCLMVLVLAEHANTRSLDVLKVLKMLLIHDIVEIDAGDTFAYASAQQVDQHARESRPLGRIRGAGHTGGQVRRSAGPVSADATKLPDRGRRMEAKRRHQRPGLRPRPVHRRGCTSGLGARSHVNRRRCPGRPPAKVIAQSRP